MKRLLFALLILFASGAGAVQITIDLPAALVTRAGELCTRLQLEQNARTTSAVTNAWDNKACAEFLLRIGFRTVERRISSSDAQQTARDTVNTAVSNIETNWPETVIYERARCGDSIVDNGVATEFDLGETCDDGNTTPGDGCNAVCQTE